MDTLPLPIELREKIYGHFVHQHTLDERMKHELQFHCGKFWIEKMRNGFKREESSRKLYAMNDFISMMINGMDLGLDVKIQLALCWHQGGKERPIETTTRWTFILFGRIEDSFLNVLKMKSVLFNFYVRYEKGSFQDEEGTVETMKGYILFDRDVTKNIVHSALAIKNIEKHICPNSGISYFSEMDSAYTQGLGNEKLHQNFIEHEEKWKNRGICEFAL